jgi:hypothetical protein
VRGAHAADIRSDVCHLVIELMVATCKSAHDRARYRLRVQVDVLGWHRVSSEPP